MVPSHQSLVTLGDQAGRDVDRRSLGRPSGIRMGPKDHPERGRGLVAGRMLRPTKTRGKPPRVTSWETLVPQAIFRGACERRARTGGGTISGQASDERRRVVAALAEAGFVAPEAEAEALSVAADEGVGALEDLLARRLRGEPLAWITGSA